MKLKNRLLLFAAGAFFVFYGMAKLHRHGVFPYLNWQHQPVFPIGVVIIGLLFSALAFLPPGKWVDRMIKRKRVESEPHLLQYLDEHRHKHRGA